MTSHPRDCLTQQQIKNISFGDVARCPGFAHAKLLDINIIIRKKDGWINTTQLCQKFPTSKGKPKDFNDWKGNAFAEELMTYVAFYYGIPKCEEFVPTKVNNNIILGMYSHPALIVAIASWCSSVFAFQVGQIVMNYNGNLQLQQKEEADNQHALEKTEMMARHVREMEEMTARHAQELRDARSQLVSVTNTHTQEATDLRQQLTTITTQANVIANDTVPTSTRGSDRNVIVILELGCNGDFHTYVMRVTRSVKAGEMEKLRLKFPNLSETEEIEVTHGIKTWKLVLRQLRKANKIQSKWQKVHLVSISVQELIASIKTFYNNRKQKYRGLVNTAVDNNTIVQPQQVAQGIADEESEYSDYDESEVEVGEDESDGNDEADEDESDYEDEDCDLANISNNSHNSYNSPRN